MSRESMKCSANLRLREVKSILRVQPKGHARARIFVNGVMVEEQSLQ